MKKIFIILIFLITSNIFAAEVIKVGGYNFPPFLTWTNHKPFGMTVKLLEKFNKIQSKYVFELVETSSLRRYEDFQNHLFDMLIFENIEWGWSKFDLKASKVFMNGGEVFITASNGHKQDYFNNIQGKRIRGFKGYHYKFLNNLNDENTLKANNVSLTTSHEGNIEAVLLGDSDLAIVTMEFLVNYLEANPQTKNKILISKKFDQKYKHTILLRNDSKVSIAEINNFLKEIRPTIANLK